MDQENGEVDGTLTGCLPEEVYGLPADRALRRWQSECQGKFRQAYRAAGDKPFTFIVAAGVASGKTMLAASIAGFLLNRKAIDRVVFVCPNLAIMGRVAEEFRAHNIHLATWTRRNKKKLARGEWPRFNGTILTNASLAHSAKAQRRLCSAARTLVILDEIHHLGGNLAWSRGARTAFEGKASIILGMSGTPYRADNRPIPFVNYEPEVNGIHKFRADFNYTLGRSVREGVCRRPVFRWSNSHVKMKMPDGTFEVHDFAEDLPEDLANRRLKGAVLNGSTSRSRILSDAVEFCRKEGRKLIIFLGGDTTHAAHRAVRDATEFLPMELRSLGVSDEEMCSVVGEDPEAPGRIARFGKSPAWILIAVNMVSEGVDIPELSAALFLTSITARATTIQRIGRVLRGRGGAVIFMFADPRYKQIALDIEEEVVWDYEVGEEEIPEPERPEAAEPAPRDPTPASIGLDCTPDGETVAGVWYPNEIVEKYGRVKEIERIPEGQDYKAIVYPLIARGMYDDILSSNGGLQP